MLPTCQRYGMGVMAWSLSVVEALIALAEGAGISLMHLALAFVVPHPALRRDHRHPTREQRAGLLAGADVVFFPTSSWIGSARSTPHPRHERQARPKIAGRAPRQNASRTSSSLVRHRASARWASRA